VSREPEEDRVHPSGGGQAAGRVDAWRVGVRVGSGLAGWGGVRFSSRRVGASGNGRGLRQRSRNVGVHHTQLLRRTRRWWRWALGAAPRTDWCAPIRSADSLACGALTASHLACGAPRGAGGGGRRREVRLGGGGLQAARRAARQLRRPHGGGTGIRPVSSPRMALRLGTVSASESL